MAKHFKFIIDLQGVQKMVFKTTFMKITGLIVGTLLFLLFICISIVYGYTETTWHMAFEAFRNFDG